MHPVWTKITAHIVDVSAKMYEQIETATKKCFDLMSQCILHFKEWLQPIMNQLNDWMIDQIRFIMDHFIIGIGKILNGMEPFITYCKSLLNKFLDSMKNILQICRDCCSKIVTEMMRIFGDCLQTLWNFMVFAVIWMRRCLLEMNVTKLHIQNDDASGYLHNFEIGIYYATLSGDNELTVSVSQDDEIYFWLRNNNELRQANAKIIIGNNQNQAKTVRLNKRQSHIVPFHKQIFENEKKNNKCVKIKMEFVLEDIEKTRAAHKNPQKVHRRDSLNGENEDEAEENVSITGNGAKYIVVDATTKCKHEFDLCFK